MPWAAVLPTAEGWGYSWIVSDRVVSDGYEGVGVSVEAGYDSVSEGLATGWVSNLGFD